MIKLIGERVLIKIIDTDEAIDGIYIPSETNQASGEVRASNIDGIKEGDKVTLFKGKTVKIGEENLELVEKDNIIGIVK